MKNRELAEILMQHPDQEVWFLDGVAGRTISRIEHVSHRSRSINETQDQWGNDGPVEVPEGSMVDTFKILLRNTELTQREVLESGRNIFSHWSNQDIMAWHQSSIDKSKAKIKAYDANPNITVLS